ncbi:pentapeptide repeat protein [Methyloglobulus morosus KoM1]|uniref:Pentapeptide repeat protein n=1 Tax=Methyloglobulus morosus KoM1 TaxID=1116472 RepID=V5BKP8_9GAMM|nr:pentapeptide repeat-containing protein [Methyloglobulus morosus]ESS68364.1 pentapeptide repeat protein [Methyloglobulus morosus KoM1]
MAKPVIFHNPLYELLRSERVDEFNERKAAGEATEGLLSGGDFRGLDLRNLDADGLDLRDGYFRGADLRGIDFRKTNIEGASFCQAQISGCYFPIEVPSEEIRLSIDLGIRIRYHNR